MPLENHRWKVSDTVFATRIMVTDVEGFFKQSLVIEPGTVAYVVDEGIEVGVVPAGEYTLRTFLDRLQFWKRKQATVILTRSEFLPIEFACQGIPTSEMLAANISVRVAIQIADIGNFLNNLLGPRDEFTVAELRNRLLPLVQQAAWQAIGSRSMVDLRGPQIASELSKQIQAAINLSFQRYGVRFVDVETVLVSQEGFEKYQQQKSEDWLELLGEQAKNERMEGDLSVMTRRIQVRDQLRDAVRSDKMSSVRNREELAKFLLDVDKEGLLRQEEIDKLVEEFDSRKQDRESAREHLDALLGMNREQEVDELRDRMAHAVRVRALQSEIELSQTAGQLANTQWRQELELERAKAEQRRQSRKEELAAKWERIREHSRQQRDESWERLAHERRMNELRVEVEVGEAERKSRVALIEQDAAARLDQQKIEMERRRKEWELDLANRQNLSQMERLRQVQEMNLQMEERQKRMHVEIDELKQDRSHQREIQRLDAMGKLSTEALIATAGSTNASVLADLKKHEASEHSRRYEADVAKKDTLNEERLRLYEKLNETEKAKADAIAQAFQAAMHSQQATVQQMISGLAQASQPRVIAPPPVPVRIPAQDNWHVAVGGETSGPLSGAQLRTMVSQGTLTAAIMVWRPGMAGWLPAGQVPEIADLLANFVPPPPPMVPPPPPAP